MDRLDYVSTIFQEHAYSLAIESLLHVRISQKASLLRMLFCEITRVLNHLMAVTTHALDVGAITPFLWGFELREQLMEYVERSCGARLHASYIIPGGVTSDISLKLLQDINKFAINFDYRLSEISEVLNNNRIWYNRLKNIGIVSYKDACAFAFSGVLLRACGYAWDLRIVDAYESYNMYPEFCMPIATNGDSFDRYLLRMMEMQQSAFLMRLICKDLLFFEENYSWLDSKSMLSNDKISRPKRSFLKKDMEALIQHFKLITEGFFIPLSETYRVIEAPKGEFAIGLTADQSSHPYRCRIKAPGLLHLQGINLLCNNLLLSDLVTVIGTLDLVFGEIDK
jgi:NADH:ubiquinone oxidoreductase subunit D